MLQILQVVLPVFFIIGAGYLAAYKNRFSGDQANSLMRFATQFAVPCLLFLGVAKLDLNTVFKPNILVPFYVGASVSFIIIAIAAKFFFRHAADKSIAIGFAGLFSNSVLIGVAIVELAYGLAGLEPAFAVIAIHAPFCYIVGITAMEFSKSRANANGLDLASTLATVAQQVFSNALTVGLMLGFTVNLLDITLPAPLAKAIELFARAALPAALFALGAILVFYKVTDDLKEVAVVSFGKLFIHPMTVYLLGRFVFNLPDELLKPVVIIAAMPPGINAYVFATMYENGREIAASSVLIATALSIATISAWLIFLG